MKIEWLNTVAKISESGTAECPECRDTAVKAVFKPVRGKSGFIVVWCEQCRHAAIVSRAEDNGAIPKSNQIPENLIYT